ncbi:uncharacterized protein [Linepithema humile]|uniref:uncharacterized protein n=1 Tax=Linepithema humile TaxID=83485 RepID=UPI0006236587|nr:PREDICTED: uncharacterized protein LOC105675090 [Linepithema humile]
MKTKHIDKVQTPTVDEHFTLIMEDNNVIDQESGDVTSNNLPDWYDVNLYAQAQSFYRRNVLSVSINHVLGLIAVLSLPDVLKVLIYTKQHNTVCSAYKRYLETLLHIHTLFMCNPNDPNSKWYKSMNLIRWKHRISSKKSKNANLGAIQQKDMVLTQFGFAAFLLIADESLGLHCTPEEREAFNHFWRVNGYMLGISDRLNLCRKTALETSELCQKIAKNVYAIHLKEVTSDFYFITSNVINGLWFIDMTCDTDAFLTLIYRVFNIKYSKPLGWYSWFNLKYRDFIIYLCLKPYIGSAIKTYFNYLLLYTYWLAEKWPILPWLTFGNNCQINLYPKHKESQLSM